MQPIEIEKFPQVEREQSDKHPAIRAFGRRFFKSQTVVEYLAEFLLCVASPKSCGEVSNPKEQQLQPFLVPYDDARELVYYPKTRLPLKFFSFFSSSKLETRYVVHQREYRSKIQYLQGKVSGCAAEDSPHVVRSFQELLSGFVGIAKNRTWATRTFLPVSRSLLAREIMWAHSRAVAPKPPERPPQDWQSSLKYFEINKHNFMARGGELLYLQLLNVFCHPDDDSLVELTKVEGLKHVFKGSSSSSCSEQLCVSLSVGLTDFLNELSSTLGQMAGFIEENFSDLVPEELEVRPAACGWVPRRSTPEGLLFAYELDNICAAKVDALDKAEALQILVILQVMRSLCFQSARLTEQSSAIDFVGKYAWIISSGGKGSDDIKKIAAENYLGVEKLILGAMQGHMVTEGTKLDLDSQDNTYGLFRGRGKDIGFVVPKTGAPMRFFMSESILRTLVMALLRPGERVRFDEFQSRMFHHYGIAVGGDRLKVAAEWTNPDLPEKSSWSEPNWLAAALSNSGFLVPLSDAISIVRNPFGSEE